MKKYTDSFSTMVSVLIPARNEADKILDLLNDLKIQDYKNIEVIVYDDHSEDQTAELVESFSDHRFHLIKGGQLPDQWLGKNYGCKQLAAQAKGEYLLFIDADVRIVDDVIGRAVHFAQQKDIQLLSLFPKQIMKTFGERISVPIMNYILLTLLPLIFVRKSMYTSHSAANGQFMLFQADSYRETQPHERFKNEKVEDICISRYLKKIGKRISCHSAEQGVQCRMYSCHREAIHGFSKNVSHFFGKSHLIGFLFTISVVACAPLTSHYISVDMALGILLIQVLSSICVSIVSHQNIVRNIQFLPLQIISLAMMLIQSVIKKYRKEYQWKGRIYKS